MEFELSEEQRQIKMSVREFAESEIAPHVMEWDEAQHFPIELKPKLADLGLMGVLFPEEYGGAGMSNMPRSLRSSPASMARLGSRSRLTIRFVGITSINSELRSKR
jgi:alkylation response protein AidB-like acyl-CoA dehydrogenase